MHAVRDRSSAAETPVATLDLVAVQRRTLRVLFATQIVGGIGVGIGASVEALLAAELAGIRVSGLAPSATVVGAALLTLPATEIVRRRGRRPSLAACYLVAALGSIVVVMAAVQGAISLLFAGFFLFGGAAGAGLQARYAAVDLAPAALHGRHLSVIVWATTLGAIAGPNLAAFAGASLDDHGVPTLAGPFCFSVLLFGLAAIVLMVLMRPDPAVLRRRAGARSAEGAPLQKHLGMRGALRAVVSHPSARLGVTAMAVGHLVMIGVMAMTPGLMVLGIGWSSTMVAGSTLLSESVSVELRTSAQGLSDVTMGLAGASAGALSGAMMHAWGFPMLAFIAALSTTPFIVLASAHVGAKPS